jgi:hypothetical protein
MVGLAGARVTDNIAALSTPAVTKEVESEAEISIGIRLRAVAPIFELRDRDSSIIIKLLLARWLEIVIDNLGTDRAFKRTRSGNVKERDYSALLYKKGSLSKLST